MNISSRFDLGDEVKIMNGKILGTVDAFYYDRSKVINIHVEWIDENGVVVSRYFYESELRSV